LGRAGVVGVHRYQPKTKWKSMQWKHPSSPVAKKFKMQPSEGRLMLNIFWDSQEPVLETYLERGKTVTSATYCDILQRGLKPAILSKRGVGLSEGVLLSHDNARHWGLHVGNPQEIEVESQRTSSSQPSFWRYMFIPF
jgi:hypothetical protein